MAIIMKEVVVIQSSVGSQETLVDQIFSVNKLDNPLVNWLLIAQLDLWLTLKTPYLEWSRMSSHHSPGVTKTQWTPSLQRRASKIVLPQLAHLRDKLSQKNWKGNARKSRSALSVSRTWLIPADQRLGKHVTVSLISSFRHLVLFQMINSSRVKFLDSLLRVPELWFTYSSMLL